MKKEEVVELVKQNFKPALSVAIVSIPLSIAISIASGAGPAAGIITGFWATIVAGFFGGSHYNVVGPAGALTSILFGVAAGSIAGIAGGWILPVLAVMSGIIIFITYLLKGERYLRYVPSSVVFGFAAGVAISIAATQLKEAFGLFSLKLSGHTLKDIYHIFANIVDTNGVVFSVFLVSFVFLLTWKKYIKSVPGILPLTVMGILFGFFTRGTDLSSDIVTISERYKDISFSLFSVPSLSEFSQLFTEIDVFLGLVEVAAIVAVISILETLITARIGDQLTGTRFNQNKEIRGLALANFVSGIMGGLPATGVFVRTGLNIKSGATHRTSVIIIGLITGLGAVLLFPILKFMPMVVIAAILYMTAIGLIEIEHFKKMWKENKIDFWIAITVAALILIFDPGIAVAVGSLVALISFIEKASNGNSEVILNYKGKMVEKTTSNKISRVKKKYDVIVYSIAGFCSYLDAQGHVERLLEISRNKNVKVIVLRLRNTSYFDTDAIDAISFAIKELKKQGIIVAVSSSTDELKHRLVAAHNEFSTINKDKLFFPKSSVAVEKFANL